MLSEIIALVFVVGLSVGPLLWRLGQDRRTERALAIRAQVHAALVQALGGESVVTVSAELPRPWRAGRVVLSAPFDWQYLLEPAWHGIMDHVPDGYELVVKSATPAARSVVTEDVALRRAA
jgi:hypothetical protein